MRFLAPFAIAVCLLAPDANAQLVVGPAAGGVNTTVQLPTLRAFRTSSSFFVQHARVGNVGGIGCSRSGSSNFGAGLPGRPFRNRGIGGSTSSGGVSVRASIIDHSELDEAVLAEAARRRGDPHDAFGRPIANAPPLPPGVVPPSSRYAPKATTTSTRRSPIAPNPGTLWRPRR